MSSIFLNAIHESWNTTQSSTIKSFSSKLQHTLIQNKSLSITLLAETHKKIEAENHPNARQNLVNTIYNVRRQKIMVFPRAKNVSITEKQIEMH